MGNGRGLSPLQPPVSLPAAWRAQKVNDEPVKVFNLLFFINFFRKWAETLEKLRFFSFGPKQCFYLTHSACEYSEKLALKKNKYGNFKRLYLKSYSKFRGKTSIFRKFIQFSSKQSGFSSVVFLHALPTWVQVRGLRFLQLRCRCQQLAGFEELRISSKSIKGYRYWIQLTVDEKD